MEKISQFGFSLLPESEKAERVESLFAGVAGYYDLMNDLMSAGLHRIWKRQLAWLAAAQPRERWLDLACGSGDIASLLRAGGQPRQRVRITLADPSDRMLAKGRRRLGDGGDLEYVRCPAEDMPFADASFDGIACAFGMRNFTDIGAALAEIRRVLRPGGRVLILEFARPAAALRAIHRRYLLCGLPAIGALVAGDRASYRYLGESILSHPPQDRIAAMMEEAGLEFVDWIDLAGGIVSIHRARRAGWQ